MGESVAFSNMNSPLNMSAMDFKLPPPHCLSEYLISNPK